MPGATEIRVQAQLVISRRAYGRNIALSAEAYAAQAGLLGIQVFSAEGHRKTGKLFHVPPADNESRALLKCSFIEPLLRFPKPRYNARPFTGRHTNSCGPYGEFEIEGTRPFQLRGHDARPLAMIWPLRTVPDPNSVTGHDIW